MVKQPGLPLPYYLKIIIPAVPIMKGNAMYQGPDMPILLPQKNLAVMKITAAAAILAAD